MTSNKLHFPAFFVVGYPRSGTSLLASLLNRHSKIAIPPETQFYRIFLRDKDIKHYKLLEDLIRFYCNYPRISDLNLEPSDFKPYRHYISHDIRNLLSVSLKLFSQKQGKSIAGEKSPGHLLFWKELLDFYPHVKIICIVRDGRDCVFSNINQTWTTSNPFKHAAEWSFYVKNYNELCQHYPEHVMLVKFEDLLTSTSAILSDICAYIGCTFEYAQLNPSEHDVTVPKWEKAWKVNASSSPDTTRVYAWKANDNINLINEISYLMKNALAQFEYEPGGKLSIIETIKLLSCAGIYSDWIYPIAKEFKHKFGSASPHKIDQSINKLII